MKMIKTKKTFKKDKESKTMGMADITRFNILEVRGEIYRHKYVKVRMKYGVWSE